MTRTRNIAQVGTRSRSGHTASGYGTPVVEHHVNAAPGRSAPVAGPPPKNVGECGEPTKAGGKCKARPTATGMCIGHTRQAAARG